jgi:urease accessory protein
LEKQIKEPLQPFVDRASNHDLSLNQFRLGLSASTVPRVQQKIARARRGAGRFSFLVQRRTLARGDGWTERNPDRPMCAGVMAEEPAGAPGWNPEGAAALPDHPGAAASDPRGPSSGWRGQLALRFESRSGRTASTRQTVLAEQVHRGPLLVQRPFYPEPDGTCHVYLLHPPGGMVGGDRLRIEARVGPGARALLTTPAAGKFYRTAGADAELVQSLHVAEAGCLEWLPQETLVYSGAQAAVRTEVHLAEGARFLGWEILCLGRPAAGERFESGWCRTSIELWRAGRRLFTERARFEGGGEILDARWGLAGYPLTGTFFAACDDPRLAERVRERVQAVSGDGLFSVTAIEGVLVARYLGQQAEAARRWLVPVWDAVRLALLGKAAALPRIWYT